MCAALVAWFFLWSQPKPQNLTQQDIDAAVLRTLDDKPLRPDLKRVAAIADREAFTKLMAETNGAFGNGR